MEGEEGAFALPVINKARVGGRINMDGGVEENSQKGKRTKQYKKFPLNNGCGVITAIWMLGQKNDSETISWPVS